MAWKIIICTLKANYVILLIVGPNFQKTSDISTLFSSKLSLSKGKCKRNGTAKPLEGGCFPYWTTSVPCPFSRHTSAGYFIPFISPSKVTHFFVCTTLPVFLIDCASLCNVRATNNWESVTPTCSQVHSMGPILHFLKVYLLVQALICQYRSDKCDLTTVRFGCENNLLIFAICLPRCLLKGQLEEHKHSSLINDVQVPRKLSSRGQTLINEEESQSINAPFSFSVGQIVLRHSLLHSGRDQARWTGRRNRSCIGVPSIFVAFSPVLYFWPWDFFPK